MTAGLVHPGSFQFVEVDGVRLRVRIRGGGRPLLLIMGLGGNIEMWGPFDPGTGGIGDSDDQLRRARHRPVGRPAAAAAHEGARPDD